MGALKPFLYERPTSLEELGALLDRYAGIVPRYLAGGTDLLVAMRTGKDAPELVVDLKGLPELSGINTSESGKLWIGALTTIHSLEINETIRNQLPLLFEAAQSLGSWQVRNRGTIGGNLANGAPTADTAIPLLALDAEICAWSPAGKRRMAIATFWAGAKKTALREREIITGVEISVEQGIASTYLKLGRRQAMDIAIVSAAAVIKLDQGLIRKARIALGGAGPTPLRARAAEAYLRGRSPIAEHIIEAGKLAAKESNPRTSARASREYRLAVIPVLVERTIRSCLKRLEDLKEETLGQRS